VAHGLAIEATPGLDVVAVASRTEARAAERAGQLDARACSYDELRAGADVVVIATPTALHAVQALHVLERGAAAIVEKPLCTTLAEADRLVEADLDGTRIGYAENLAFAPAVNEALKHVREHSFPTHLEARALQQQPTWGDFLTEGWGGGVLFDLGVHPLALVLLAAAPARPVRARCQLESSEGLVVDDWAELALEFDSGLTARVEASWRDDAPQWDLQAAAPDAVVRIELQPYLQLEVNGEPVAVPSAPDGAPVPQVHDYGYVNQLRSFVADHQAGKPMMLGASFGRDVLDIVCAAYTSARSGEEVALPFSGLRDRTPLQLWRG
jgi:predicted dehydrogenase